VLNQNTIQMKTTLTIFFTIVFTIVNAQSNLYSTFVDNSNQKLTLHLEVLPWNSNELCQVNKSVYPVNNRFVYSMDIISTGNPESFSIPQCLEISERPMFLNSGILFAGKTASNGYELMYYDGISTTIFDINVGNADSDPIIYVFEGGAYFTAVVGGIRQAFRFDESSLETSQLTNETRDISSLEGALGEVLYYTTSFYNTGMTLYENEFKTVELTGSYNSILIRSFNTVTGQSVYWTKPIEKWGKLFFLEAAYYFNANDNSSELRIFSIDSNGGTNLVHNQDQISTSISSLPRLFEWENKLYFYNKTELFSCASDENFSIESTSLSGTFARHTISENGKLYIVLEHLNDTQDVVEYENSNWNLLYSGRDIHFLLENDNMLYLSDYAWQDSSSIILLNSIGNNVIKVNIKVGAHSPFIDAALIYNDRFTFLFTLNEDENEWDTDVLQLATIANVQSRELHIGLYPNPILSGTHLNIETNQSGKYQLLSYDGKLIQVGEIYEGKNKVQLAQINPGMYLLKCNGSVVQIHVY
jgi:hypothetical protein